MICRIVKIKQTSQRRTARQIDYEVDHIKSNLSLFF